MSGGESLARLRRDLSDARVAREADGWKYTAEIRERALAYVRGRRGEGHSIKRIAAELGMPWQTLDSWFQKQLADAVPTSGALRPVTLCTEVVPNVRSASALVVHGPRGLRIEGLGIEDLAELVRRLS